MTGAVKLNTAGGGSVVVQPASSIASDVTVNVPSAEGTLIYANSAGNVGIGSTSPDSGGSSARWLTLGSTGSAYSGGVIYHLNGVRQFLHYQDSDNLFAHQGAGSNAGQKFLVGGSERMRIDSSGNLLVGTTSVGSNGVSLVPNGTSYFYSGGTNTLNIGRGTNDGTVVQFQRSGTNCGSISVTTTTTTYATSSDYRLKENIAPMAGALATVSQLNPVTYTWKSTGEQSQGFIAHELQAVVPDCVTGEKDAVDAEGNPVYQGIDTSFLVATLCKAIQEQQEQINELKAEIATLKGDIV